MDNKKSIEERAYALGVYPHQVENVERWMENMKQKFAHEKTIELPLGAGKSGYGEPVMVIDSMPDFIAQQYEASKPRRLISKTGPKPGPIKRNPIFVVTTMHIRDLQNRRS